jgi:integral membrane sensor domain MASE1
MDTPPQPHSGRLLRSVFAAAAVVAGGVVSLMAGLITSGPSGQSSVVWLPPGFAVAAVLVWGRGIWPGLLLGNVCLDALMAYHEAPNAGFKAMATLTAVISSASVLQTLAIRALVHRFAGRTVTLDRSKAVLRFLLCSALASVISSTSGSLALIALGIRSAQTLLADNSSWWISDTLSVFLITPVVMSWIGAPALVWRPRRLQLTVPLLVALVLMASAYVQANHVETDRAQRQFELRTSHLKATLEQKVDEITHDVYALRDIEEMAATATEDQFRAFASRLRAQRGRDLAGLGADRVRRRQGPARAGGAAQAGFVRDS